MWEERERESKKIEWKKKEKRRKAGVKSNRKGGREKKKKKKKKTHCYDKTQMRKLLRKAKTPFLPYKK